jgi:hypothetical protein
VKSKHYEIPYYVIQFCTDPKGKGKAVPVVFPPQFYIFYLFKPRVTHPKNTEKSKHYEISYYVIQFCTDTKGKGKDVPLL